MDTKTTTGQTLAIDSWRNGYAILRDADGYEGADFRVTLPMTEVSVPITVTVTGRKVRFDAPIVGGGIRVKVEFLDDDDAPVVARGWISWTELRDGSVRLNPGR